MIRHTYANFFNADLRKWKTKTVVFCVFLAKVLKMCYITNPVIYPLNAGLHFVANGYES